MCMVNTYSELKTDKIKVSIKICTFGPISTAQQNIFEGQRHKCSSVIVMGIYLTRHAIYTMDSHWKPLCLCPQAFANGTKTDIWGIVKKLLLQRTWKHRNKKQPTSSLWIAVTHDKMHALPCVIETHNNARNLHCEAIHSEWHLDPPYNGNASANGKPSVHYGSMKCWKTIQNK